MTVLKTIDAHAGGEPLRLIVNGFPAPRGKTMEDKREWALRHADHLRRAVMLEPRGHADMYGAVLTEPTTPGSHAGLLFMHNAGFSTMCGHGVIAVTTIALERGLLMPRGDGRSVAFDTPAGTVRAAAEWDAVSRRVRQVRFTNVPSFVVQGGLNIVCGGRRVRVDVAFGGAFYAIVDAESVGVALDGTHLPELRRVGEQIKQAVEAVLTVKHPIDERLVGIYGTIFTGPARGASADLRNVTVFANAEVDRSPCGTGTAAVMAVIDAMGLLDDHRPFVHEGIVGTTFSGRVAGRTVVGDYSAIVPEIEGSAWITGDHTFIVDDDDPLREGFRL